MCRNASALQRLAAERKRNRRYDRASSIDCSIASFCPVFHSASNSATGIVVRRLSKALLYSAIEASEPRCVLIGSSVWSRASSAPTNRAAGARWPEAICAMVI